LAREDYFWRELSLPNLVRRTDFGPGPNLAWQSSRASPIQLRSADR